MKRLLVLLLVFGLALAVAAPARAAKPDCESDSSHPSCKPDPEPPLVGQTCAERGLDHTGSSDDGNFLNDGDFVLELDGGYQEWCVDVTNVNTGDWDILIETTGKLNVQTIVLRDSVVPGDACDEAHPNKILGQEEATLTVVSLGPANDGVDACGEDFGDTDPAFAFLVFGRGTGTVTVTYPKLTP